MLYTALATKERAMARRCLAGRPTPPDQAPTMRIDLDQTQYRDQLTVLVGQWAQLLLERREQNALHDALELIQEAGNDKLHRVGTPSTLELVVITLF